jgi:branched-chain amino acid transport system permease protein
MCRSNVRRWAGFLVALAILLVIPGAVSRFGVLNIINMMYLMIIAAMGLNLILRTGHANFAHAAFIAIGAYASAFLSLKAGLPFMLCLPLAGLTGALMAWGLGRIILKVKGAYFFLITVAFSEVVRRSLAWFSDVTGGHQGIERIPKPSISIPSLFAIRIKSEVSFYYLILFFMLIALVVMYRLQRGHWGLTWRAARESDTVAESAGVDVMRYKLLAFTTGCFFAAICGSLYAHYVSFINPDTFGQTMMMGLLFAVIVGGREYFYGPIVGIVLLRGCSAGLARMAEYQPMVYGVILMIAILFFPAGVASLSSRFSAVWQQIPRLGRRSEAARSQ